MKNLLNISYSFSILIIIYFFIQEGFSQIHPVIYKPIWSQAGYPGGIPNITGNIINVMNEGVVADRSTDNYDIIQGIIDDATAPAVILFPAGTYRIKGQLNMKSGIVLRGEGPQNTHLEFDDPNGCIQLRGALSGSYTDILNGLEQGSNKIVVANVSSFSVGEGAHIRHGLVHEPTLTGWVEPHALGQMVMITDIMGDTLKFEPALNFDYASHPPIVADNGPEICLVRYIKEVGIEDLHIKRIHSDDDGAGSNINITRAYKSWIKGVESEYTLKFHFAISQSLHFEVRNNYVHHARSKGDGGQGYGVSLANQTTASLVEDNIFYECRHSMIIQLGVNGCVFGYNYAEKNYSDDGWDKTSISLHGHYVHMNLFEGNIVGWIGIGDYWGPDGPNNTFFRNRAVGTDRHMEFGDNRGIMYSDFEGPQYIVGNEVTGGDIYYYQRENSESDTSLVVIHGNNVKGNIDWEQGLSHDLPESYYLDTKPAFFDTIYWPAFGSDKVLGEGAMPALVRWESGYLINAKKTNTLKDDKKIGIANPVYDYLNLWSDDNILSFEILDINGRLLINQTVNDNYYHNALQLHPGMYYIKVITASGTSGCIFIKQ